MKIRLPLVIVLLALGVVLAGCAGNPSGILSPVDRTGEVGLGIGQRAPDFQSLDLNGETVKLSELRGKTVLLNFWATWCSPCRTEMPYLQQIAAEWQDKGLLVIGVNIGEDAATVKEFLQSNHLTFSVWLDGDSATADTYAIRYIPTTFIIDKDGVIKVFKLGGFQNKAEIEESLKEIIPQ